VVIYNGGNNGLTTITLIFILVYVGMILGGFPYLKIGRPAIALVGAVALIAGHHISGSETLECVDFGTLALLFGLMLLSIQFEMSGLYTYLSRRVGHYQVSPFILLGLLTALAGGLSAFLTNDVIAVAMTPVVLGLCVEKKLNPVPFLLGIAFATNSGAVATLVGSPQNILISQKLNLSFGAFTLYTAVPALLSLLAGWLLLSWFNRKSWALETPSGQTDERMKMPEVKLDVAEMVKGLIVAAIVIWLFVFTEHNKGLVAVTAGCFLLMNGRFASKEMLGRIDWGLLLLFFGLFVVNSAMNSTGLPQVFVNDLSKAGFQLQHPAVLFTVTAVLSDIVSNVPGVMLLLPYATDPLSGPLMAIASGLSSNMIIIGSLANIIVVDAAASRGLKISFWDFAKVGIPAGLISMLLGALWIMAAHCLR
jgi:Na+/H+ antiporter NhaD/arsenite permease-like protein